MTHLETRYVVNGRIESDDQQLLDQIESELPAEDDPVLGNEYDLSRTPVLDADGNETGTEVLSGRMTFAPDGSEFTRDADGNTLVVIEGGEPTDNEVLKANVDSADIFGPAEAAQQFHQQIVSHDLAGKADGWRVWVYESPEGGVTSRAVQAWYEADEARQPENEEGEKYVPNSFDPANHVVVEESG
jgi:hypothetical protein